MSMFFLWPTTMDGGKIQPSIVRLLLICQFDCFLEYMDSDFQRKNLNNFHVDLPELKYIWKGYPCLLGPDWTFCSEISVYETLNNWLFHPPWEIILFLFHYLFQSTDIFNLFSCHFDTTIHTYLHTYIHAMPAHYHIESLTSKCIYIHICILI